MDRMIHHLKTSRLVKLRVAQPVHVSVTIDKRGRKWGLDTHRSVQSTSVEVRAVLAGAVEDYNATVTKGQQVHVGDCILSCNGVTGLAGRVYLALQMCERAELCLLRPAA